MYEGLVKSLRYCATHDCCGEGEREAGCAAPSSLRKDCDTCNQVLQAQAADAIEKLIEVIQNHDFLESLIKPRWIPVTEALPEKKPASYLCLTDGGYCHEVRWTNSIYGLVESDDWGWSIFDVPQFSHVTHWMPLPPAPEPPKEEA